MLPRGLPSLEGKNELFVGKKRIRQLAKKSYDLIWLPNQVRQTIVHILNLKFAVSSPLDLHKWVCQVATYKCVVL